MANILYGGTKSEMERLIKDANEWGAANGKASDLSIDSFSDVVTAIEYIQEAQHIAGTTAREAGMTIEGSVNAAKSAWSNLLTEFGKSDGDIKGAMEALVTSIVGDGSDSNLGVIGNVVPRIGIIIGNAVEQIPGLVMAVAPRIGSAFLEAFDSATNGLGTKVLQFLAPVTDAIGSTIGSIGTWFAQNKGAIDSVVGALGNFASVIVGAVGSAIEFVAPIIGDLASGALPLLSAALSAAAGFVQGLGNMLSGLLDAISPVTNALAPIVSAIGTALVNALKWAGDAMSSADFSGFASIVKDALGGIVDFIDRTVQGISGFFGKVADFMKDPIGSIKRGFETLSSSGEKTGTKVAGSFSKLASKVGGSLSKLNSTVKTSKDGVSADFARMDSNVAASVKGTIGSIGKYNRTPLESKSSTAEVYGNAVNSVASAAVSTASGAIKALTSKTVWAQVNGNATEGGTATNIWSVASGINALVSKTVNVVTNFIKNFLGNAAGGIRYHADGMIVNQPTWIGGRDIAGEDGAEAIIPLTNKRYTRPFAETVAEQMAGHAGGTNIYINGAKVNDDPQIAAAFERFMMAANRKWAM